MVDVLLLLGLRDQGLEAACDMARWCVFDVKSMMVRV